MKRRDFLKTTAAAASVAVSSPLLAQSAQPKAEGPNLLIIQTDEHHFNTLGCYGGKWVGTPNIDFLAENGARCTSFYAATPVCSPSRASFISGMYPQNTPVTTNDIPLHDDVVSFAELLRQQGYETGYAGKWHLDGNGKPQWEPERQFGFEDNRYMFNRGHWKKFEITDDGPRVAARGANGTPSYNVDNADEKSFSTDWLTDRAIDFINEHRDGPFCYMLSLPDPHGPNTVRAPYDTMYDDAEVYIPTTLNKTPDQIPEFAPPAKIKLPQLINTQRKYYGMVKCIDDNVGRILDTLRQDGLLDNTIVVFTSDHGDLCGEHGRFNKGVPYEGSAKIPFIVYYPAKIKPGTVINVAMNTTDFMPTILDLIGCPVPTKMKLEGRDTACLFTDGTPDDWHDITFMRGTQNWLCVMTNRYKLVYPKQGKPWLFDLQADPDELTNFFDSANYRDVRGSLTKELADYCKRCNDPYGDDPHIKAEMDAVLVK